MLYRSHWSQVREVIVPSLALSYISTLLHATPNQVHVWHPAQGDQARQNHQLISVNDCSYNCLPQWRTGVRGTGHLVQCHRRWRGVATEHTFTKFAIQRWSLSEAHDVTVAGPLSVYADFLSTLIELFQCQYFICGNSTMILETLNYVRLSFNSFWYFLSYALSHNRLKCFLFRPSDILIPCSSAFFRLLLPCYLQRVITLKYVFPFKWDNFPFKWD